MLKVVGASWLQTRISTYILVAVALLGVGAIILGEFGRVENDGTYSATVSWNHKGGYRVDFLGQSNDLASLKLNVARAYYKTGIFESGWSIIEIETSSKYPDTQQAYAAGLLEGSLTWQLIHHHWHNTINAVCERRADECRKLMQFLRENTAIIRERAELLEATDPFWHMVRLFYIQLDGLEAGWRFGVRRSRQSVEMDTEHFLWLAMAADLPDLELVLNASDSRIDYTKGTIFLKSLPRENLDPLLAVGHTTSAPYATMLRLLKKFTFGYHVLPMPKSAQVPGRSIVMSSYPGALSSHDELYLIRGQSHELIVAGTPLTVTDRRDLNNFIKSKNQVMSSVRVMAANRLAINGCSWSHILSLQNGGNGARQWVTLESRDRIIWLIEQLSPGIIRAADISERFAAAGILCLTGKAGLREIAMVIGGNSDDYENYNGDDDDDDDDDVARSKLVARLQKNITTAERFSDLMRGYSHEDITNIAANELPQILAYRGDLEKNNRAVPFGVIDSKIVLADVDGIQSFEATSGPSMLDSQEPFRWSKIFPNVSHIGQPDVFNFGSVTPLWVWV